jgi:ribonuclease BN (tRNA processing enzyme)
LDQRLELRVLGCAGGYPYGGVACSGYLVSPGGGEVMLLDCGPGVAARLLALKQAVDLDAVVISHLHPDHVLDLVPLAYAAMTEWISLGRVRRIPVSVPRGGIAFLRRLTGLFGHRDWRFDGEAKGEGLERLRLAASQGRDWVFDVLDLSEFDAGDSFQAGPFSIDSHPARHTSEAACLATGPKGRRLVYTGDTSAFAGLIEFCRGSQALLCEAHFSGSHPPGGAHMTPRDAGDLAREAGVGQLILTHLASATDAATAVAEARAVFGGPVCLALDRFRDGAAIEIGPA